MREKVVSIAEAVKNVAALIDRAVHHHEATLIMENGKPLVRMMPVDSAKSTDESLKAWPNMNHLAPEEAAQFESDILASQPEVPPLVSK